MKTEVYLNGSLMREGSDNDYFFGKRSIYFNFKVKAQDTVTVIRRGWLRAKRMDFITAFDGTVMANTPLLMDGLALLPVMDENSPAAMQLVR